MGILVEKDEEKSRLQERIAADLRERASRTSSDEGDDDDYYVEKDLHHCLIAFNILACKGYSLIEISGDEAL